MPEGDAFLSDFISFLKRPSNDSPPDPILQKFHDYHRLILDFNNRINLISHNDIRIIWSRHFLDSLQITPLLTEVTTIIDLGTGAGFPSIPLKIVNPEIKMCLVDSNHKRIDFLFHVIQGLCLSNIRLLEGRTESIAHSADLREFFDATVSRAMAPIGPALELCLPFVRVGGKSVFWISSQDFNREDIDTIAGKLGGRFEQVIEYRLPSDSGDNHRSLLVINKYHSTDPQYPRRVGIPTKRPLK